MDIKSLINKVIASKGILRVPSWWMKKLLTEIIGYIDSGDSANKASIDKVKNDVDGEITTLESNTDSKISTLESDIRDILLNLKRSLHTQKCFVVETGSSSGYVIVDGVRQDIPANTKKVLTYVDSFKFSDASSNKIIFVGLNVSDTSAIVSMAGMFVSCAYIKSLDFSGINTSAVTDMRSMFSRCDALISLDLSSFDTSSVTNMDGMFYRCSELTSLDLSGFDTSSVTNMDGMFYHCSKLTSLDLSGFDTSSVTNMDGMFLYCYELTSLDLTSFNTSSVTNMYRMFENCVRLLSLDLSSFDTSSVTNMNRMFENCNLLVSLILGPNFFKTSAVTSISFSSLWKWTNDTVVTSLVTNSYDRASAGLNTLTLKLRANTKAVLTDEQKAAITSKGYTIA